MYEIEVWRIPRPGRPADWKEGDEEPEMRRVDEKHVRFQTPYTSSKCGQSQFGGFNEAGQAKYEEVLALIKENRKTEAAYVKAVEELALERIQEAQNVKEKAEPTKKRKAVVEDVVDMDDYDNF